MLFGIRFISSLQLTSMLQRYRWKAKFKGKLSSAVVVTGKFSASGTLHALQMLRAKSSEQLWDMDIGPQ